MRAWLLDVFKIGVFSSLVYLALVVLAFVFHERLFELLGAHGYYFFGDMD